MISCKSFSETNSNMKDGRTVNSVYLSWKPLIFNKLWVWDTKVWVLETGPVQLGFSAIWQDISSAEGNFSPQGIKYYNVRFNNLKFLIVQWERIIINKRGSEGLGWLYKFSNISP